MVVGNPTLMQLKHNEDPQSRWVRFPDAFKHLRDLKGDTGVYQRQTFHFWQRIEVDPLEAFFVTAFYQSAIIRLWPEGKRTHPCSRGRDCFRTYAGRPQFLTLELTPLAVPTGCVKFEGHGSLTSSFYNDPAPSVQTGDRGPSIYLGYVGPFARPGNVPSNTGHIHAGSPAL